MPPSPKEVAARWAALSAQASAYYESGVDAIAMAREAYVAERLTLEEFEAEVAKLLAGEA